MADWVLNGERPKLLGPIVFQTFAWPTKRLLEVNIQRYRKLLESKLMRRAQKMQAHIENVKFKKNRECLHPDSPDKCSGDVIASHSVQRAMLKRIAGEDGRIYMPVAKPTSSFSPYLLHKRGIDKASAFYGFCEKHDNDMFKPIESGALQFDEQHASILAYRSLSKELHTKKWLSEVDLVGVGMPEKIDMLDLMLNLPIDQHLLLERESPYWTTFELHRMSELHLNMGSCIERGDYSSFRFYARGIDCVPDILRSGLMTVVYDCDGNRLRDDDEGGPLDLLTFSLLPYGDNNGMAIFAWFGESTANAAFIDSLHSLSHDSIPDVLARLVLQYFENFFAAPNWREGFSHDQKVSLDNLMRNNVRFGPLPFSDENGVDFPIIDWNIIGEPTTNLTL